MDRAVLDKIIFYFKSMLSYKNYINDDIELLNKIYLILGKEKLKNYDGVDNNIYRYFINNAISITLEILGMLKEKDRQIFLRKLPKFIKVSILDDNKKIRFLENLRENGKRIVIISLNYSDDEKIKLLNEITDKFSRIELIKSLQDDNKKIELLKNITSERYRIPIIQSIQDDDKKITILENMKNRYSRITIITTIKDDDKKLELLKQFETEEDRTQIIKSLKDDGKKIELLADITDEDNRTQIIQSLKDDDKKIKLLENITKEKNRVYIIKTIQDDDKKIHLLGSISRKIDQIDIIKSMQDDDKKIKLIDEKMSEQERVQIIQSLQDDDKKISMLCTVSNKYDRCRIIKEIQVDDKKIEALRYLDDLNLKFAVIKTLNDDRKKDYVINKIDKRLNGVYQAIKEFEDGKIYNDYKYKSVGLPEKMTFGIEIECEGKYKELPPNYIGKWECKEDESVGDDSLEVVSPVMHNSRKSLGEIYKINEILTKMQMKTTDRCGAHVHIGADYIKTEEGFRQLIELWGNAEEIYFLIANKPGEVPRDYVKKYAMPISKKFEKFNLEKEGFIEDAKELQAIRETSLNLLNVNNKRNTIEFRVSNGTLDGDTWIENIRLYGRTVELASELGEIVDKLKVGEELTEEEKTKYALKEMLKDNIPLDVKMEILMNILFSEEERKVYQKRYSVNRKLKDEKQTLGLQFGKVDFNSLSKMAKRTIASKQKVGVQVLELR